MCIECQGDQNQNAIPAEPPPTFEEAMRYNLSSPSSSSIPPSSARESPRPRSEISCSVSNDGSSSGISDGPSSAQVASRHPTILSEWELDLSAGFSLEERVKREWERRHAETIPVPILIPEQVPLSVRHSRQTISANDNTNDTPKTDADPNMSDAKAEESDWELVEPVAAGPSLPDSSVVHHPVDATPSRSRRRPPTPPPPLPRSYVSVRDRVRQIEQGNAPSSQGTITNPVKLRRTPPAIPSAKPPKPRGNTSESSTQPRCDSTPRSETLSDEGVITLANIDINTASINPTILKDFDPLHSSASSSASPHESTNSSSEHSNPEQIGEDEDDMISPSRPLPEPPSNRSLRVVTAFDEYQLRQRRRAATVGTMANPNLSRTPLSSVSAGPSPLTGRSNRRRSSILLVANPSPESDESDDDEIRTAALLQRNHSLGAFPIANNLPVVHDDYEYTQLDALMGTLDLEDETAQGNNYNVSISSLNERFSKLTPLVRQCLHFRKLWGR